MAPAIDLEKIDWNSITGTRSLFESVSAVLKSRDEENVTLRKDIERLREEAEAIAGDHMMLTEMGARIELLEGENGQKDAEIERQAAEIEKLRAENAALLQGCDVPQAVLDRIARLERQMAGRDSQLREARAANSALAAGNLGIRSRSGRRPPEAVEPAPDPFLKVTTMSTRRNHPPISGKRLTGLCACPRGHPLSAEPTGAVFRVIEDILDGRLVAIQYTVVRRYCRKCRRQVAAEIPGILHGGWFGAGLTCLETVMRMHGIPYETIPG